MTADLDHSSKCLAWGNETGPVMLVSNSNF